MTGILIRYAFLISHFLQPILLFDSFYENFSVVFPLFPDSGYLVEQNMQYVKYNMMCELSLKVIQKSGSYLIP